MNYKLERVLLVVAGAAVGSIVTWKLMERKYNYILEYGVEEESDEDFFIDEDIENEFEEEDVKVAQPNEKHDKPDIMEYASKIDEYNYTTYSKSKEKEPAEDEESEPEEVEEESEDGIHIISPGEFGEDEDYEQESLTYYADGYLAYDSGELVRDIEYLVGFKSLESFGEYEDDAVHVKNENNSCYYEILRDLRKYHDVYSEEE